MIWVAEVGSNHRGSPALAFQMIREFSQAGATVCKFQLGHPEQDPIRNIHPWAAQAKEWCEYYGVEFNASIRTHEGLELARKIGQKRYKIAYVTARDELDLCNEIIADGKETFISASPDFLKAPNVKHIFVVSKYPTYPRDVKIPEAFPPFYGYSDHAHGIAPCLMAVARGAKYIEKHVTLSPAEESIRDHAFSSTPDEFARMVRIGNEMERLLNASV